MPPEAPDVPAWLRGLPRAPEYRPTESEFADPIAFLSRVERHAAAFGICKVIPPYHRPSRRHVFARLNTSLHASASSPSPDSAAVFTTRHQELGTPRRGHPPPHVLKQVWQSGERYTLDQFEAKSRAFSKTHLAGLPRDPSPLAVESLFWKASADRPIYVEYANDVPGSGFGPSAQPNPRRKKRKRTSSTDQGEAEEEKASVGWRLSSSPWNLQAIARAPGSLTRFMPDDVPGVTSPMVYIGMLFSWFAWHIEDHELHSLNFLHTGAPKTWYAVPGDRAAELEEVIRVHGYGGNPDRLASLAVLGEKTTLMSPEVIVAAGLPCCRLVQYPGEFVVTFPRAYHVGFSHGFNCGEAANFATPQWLKFAKEAAVRRAVMNYLPMLSHQQLLYLLAVSFISRTPRELLYGIRTSRLRDRRKEDRELLVKQEFLQDMISENELLYSFLKKKLIANAVLWEPDLLPSSTALHSCSSGPNAPGKADDGHSIESIPEENGSSDGIVHMAAIQPKCMSMDTKSSHAMSASEGQKLDTDTDDESDLPFDLSIDSGSLTCVACGILGFPFMAILQPSQKALEEMSLVDRERLKLNCEKENHSNIPPCSPDHSNSGRPFIASRPSNPVEQANFIHQNGKSHKACVYFTDKELDRPMLPHSNSSHSCSSENTLHPCINSEATETKILSDGFGTESSEQTGRGDIDVQAVESCAGSWNITSAFVRPRIFCLQHALEIEELLEGKGGAHALIICHSDYTKLKALAISIAEEIEFQFDCKDVPLANASKSDLHLINTSIDDEGYPEDGRDWTSQMGLNMKYFAKLRKEAPGSQEQPPLSFWNRLDITDKPSAPVSVVPNLKWLCRKTRTSYRVVGYVSSHNATVTPEEANPAVTKTMIGASGNADENGKKQLTVEQAVPLQPSRLQEADDIPVALAEYPMMHQVCEGPVSVSTCDDSNCSINSQDPPAVSDAFTIGQQCVQSDELTSSASMSVQQFLVSESMTAEASSNHEMIDSYNVTSECKDKLLEVQQEQDNIELCNDADRNLATVSATPENEVNCAKTSNCSDTVLKANKSSTGDLPEPYHLGADLVTRKSSCDEMISSVDRQFSLRIGCLASTDVCCSAEPSSVAHDLVSGESKAIRNPEIPIGVLEPVEAGTSHYGVQAEGVQAAPTTAISGENGNSVPAESDSLDILLGILAEESVLADVGGKDEVDNASLTLMTLASSHSADDVTQDDEVVGTSSSSAGASLSCKGQHPELHVKRENAEEVGVWNCHGLKDSTGTLDISANKNSGAPRKYQPDIVSRSIGGSKRANIICYVRRKPKRKRKRESELLLNTDSSQSLGSFSRSPCESLRPRSNNKPAATEETSASQTETATKPPSLATTKRKRTEVVELFRCDIESCDMAFESKADLRAHLRNICTDETCGKRFGSHKYLRRHQRVHCDERPFRCPWEGCGMTFKWAWAQTEHMRVHTGERPYGCAGCGQRFRYVSDYSRHRRKFNHH